MKTLVVSDAGLRAEERDAHEILQRGPLRSIPLDEGMHMVIRAREAKAGEPVNAAAVSILRSASTMPGWCVPRVSGDAVIVRPGGEVSAGDTAALLVVILGESGRA